MAIIDEGTHTYESVGEVPEGYPAKDSPVVQAVARELLGAGGVLVGDDYWHKPVTTNSATALHAAVRAVHAVLSLGDDVAPETPLPRAVIPGADLPTILYDVETDLPVGRMDTPELAEWVAERVWREVRTQALDVGEVPIRRDACERLDERYGITSRGEEPVDATPLRAEEAAETTMAAQSSVADELMWATRRLFDAQMDVSLLLARLGR